MSEFVLMHKDIPVLKCDFLDGYLVNINRIYEAEHIPVGCRNLLGRTDVNSLREWWNRRPVPMTRTNLKSLQSSFRGINLYSLVQTNFGCNLSDHYWIKPDSADLKYRDVNFFENDFSDDAVSVFLSDDICEMPSDMITASCSTGGDVPKAWYIDDDVRKLYKSSGTAFGQEPYNEHIAALLNKSLGIDHISYCTKMWNGTFCSVCNCMINIDCEIVPAYDILRECRSIGGNMTADIKSYMQFAREVGIDVDKSVSNMVVSDFLMRNTDRHWNNFGLIRDANTLRYIKAVPLFDYGNSLFHNHANFVDRDPVSKFSGMSLYQDLRYAVKASSLNLDNLSSFAEIVQNVFRNTGMHSARVDMLVSFAKSQSKRLTAYLSNKSVDGKDFQHEFG